MDTPKLTVDQIKRMLKPMADFAPAVMAGMDLLQSFEAAAKGIGDLEKQRDKVSAEIKGLEKERPRAQLEAGQAREEVAAIKKEIVETQAVLDGKKKDLAGLDEELAKGRAEIQRQLAADKKAASGELLALQAAIDTEAKKLKQAQADFNQWAKEHGLMR